MHINEIRSQFIRKYKLKNTSDVYTFFYDETNNVRSFWVNAEGMLNADVGVFVLGGIAYPGLDKSVEIESLRGALKIQKSASEIKAKHVFDGDFEKVLKSEKTTTFLEWLAAQDFQIHFSAVDPFYWSITDVVDNCLLNVFSDVHRQLASKTKSDLLRVFRENKKEALSVLGKYAYPAVSAESKNDFLNEVINLVSKSTQINDEDKKELCFVLGMGKTSYLQPLITRGSEQRLIENFAPFYFNSMVLFKQSRHVFDREDTIQNIFSRGRVLTENVARRRHLFVDSQTEPGIQVADVTVSLIGKMCTYLTQASAKEVKILRDTKHQQMRKNLGLLRQVILKSEKHNPALHHYIMSYWDLIKLKVLFQDDKRYVNTHAKGHVWQGDAALRSLGVERG